MFYEINVAKDGKHLFATAERSCISERQAQLVYNELASRFKEEDGYQITVTYWETVGHPVDMDVKEEK